MSYQQQALLEQKEQIHETLEETNDELADIKGRFSESKELSMSLRHSTEEQKEKIKQLQNEKERARDAERSLQAKVDVLKVWHLKSGLCIEGLTHIPRWN